LTSFWKKKKKPPLTVQHLRHIRGKYKAVSTQPQWKAPEQTLH
jgi:hypothetical protein